MKCTSNETRHLKAARKRRATPCTGLLTGCAMVVALATALPVSAIAQSATGPELKLFSSTIVEDIRRTSEAAESMESGVLESIEYMDQQLALYKASNCESAGEDSGCAEMRRQLSQSYGTMIDAMDAALPEMQSAIERSRDGLKQSLVSQIGRGLSPTNLQSMMLDENKPHRSAKASARSRTGGAKLSSRFQQYYTLVAGSVGSSRRGRGALAVTAADIYIDMEEASELIQLTTDEIARTKIHIDLEQAFPVMTEQMEVTVAGVKKILFGEADEAMLATIEPPPAEQASEAGTGANYASPLEY